MGLHFASWSQDWSILLLTFFCCFLYIGRLWANVALPEQTPRTGQTAVGRRPLHSTPATPSTRTPAPKRAYTPTHSPRTRACTALPGPFHTTATTAVLLPRHWLTFRAFTARAPRPHLPRPTSPHLYHRAHACRCAPSPEKDDRTDGRTVQRRGQQKDGCRNRTRGSVPATTNRTRFGMVLPLWRYRLTRRGGYTATRSRRRPRTSGMSLWNHRRSSLPVAVSVGSSAQWQAWRAGCLHTSLPYLPPLAAVRAY